MASIQEPGRLTLYMKAPSGNRKKIFSAPSAWWAPGGSADGAPANTPEKWNFLPLNNEKGTGGYQIEFEFTAPAVDGIDASDCSFQIPILVNGQRDYLGNSAHSAGLITDSMSVDLTFADYTTVANQSVIVYRTTIKDGRVVQIGGDRVFASIEDDTA